MCESVGAAQGRPQSVPAVRNVGNGMPVRIKIRTKSPTLWGGKPPWYFSRLRVAQAPFCRPGRQFLLQGSPTTGKEEENKQKAA